jgi:hypothetical protein
VRDLITNAEEKLQYIKAQVGENQASLLYASKQNRRPILFSSYTSSDQTTAEITSPASAPTNYVLAHIRARGKLSDQMRWVPFILSYYRRA